MKAIFKRDETQSTGWDGMRKEQEQDGGWGPRSRRQKGEAVIQTIIMRTCQMCR